MAGKRKSSSRVKAVCEVRDKPRTPRGRRLMELRAQIVASGVPLLGWDDIEREVAERRGENRGE